MERKAFSSSDLSNRLQETHGDFSDYPTHPHSFAHYTLRDQEPVPYRKHPPPAESKARMREVKKAGKPGGKKRWRTGWQAQLQSCWRRPKIDPLSAVMPIEN